MKKAEALIGSAAFFILAPGTVAGLMPWLITHWRFGEQATGQLSWFGAGLIALSGAALIECFLRFALSGEGTPAPMAPTGKLVVSGLYRFVRNPMYVAVLGLILGQALLFANAALLAYAVAIWLAFHIFVAGFEEPRLRAEFGEEYAAYSEAVRRWIPRLTPWRGAPD